MINDARRHGQIDVVNVYHANLHEWGKNPGELVNQFKFNGLEGE